MDQHNLFENNKQPTNNQIIDNPDNKKRLIASKFNSEVFSIVHLLIGPKDIASTAREYELYNWNITSNMLELNFISTSWNCSIKCEISASGSYFLLQDHLSSFLYRLDSNYFIEEILTSFLKNRISILDQSRVIRKKSDISKKYYIYASGKELVTITYNNKTLIRNVFTIPLIYNFNPNNFVLDARLFQNKLYILYRSILTYNIFLYEFKQAQLLFKQYPNNTRLNDTGITISQVFRFNNNYISKVIRFVRGIDLSTGNMIIWIYNENQAYKCANIPCIGFGYEIYNKIVFSAVTATNYTIAFFGKSKMVELKKFKGSLISQEIGRYFFTLNVSSTDLISYQNYTVTKLLVSSSQSLFPTVYTLVNDCKPTNGFEQSNFCKCHLPYIYDPMLQKCTNFQVMDANHTIDTVYIAFIVICSILILTLVFIIVKKIIFLRKVRKSWQYNAAQNIIFQ